jgi:chemotaxis protein CheC
VTAPFSLTEPQRDALRELANVGAGHAATSLSQLLSGQRVAFQAPEAWGLTGEGWRARLEAPWVAGVLDVQGPVEGSLWLLFSKADSEALAAQLSPPEPPVDTAVERAAHAMGASALSAMARLTGLALVSGTPALRRSDEGAALLGEAALQPLLVLSVHLRAPSLAAWFFLLPASASIGPLLRSLRV